MGYNVIQEFGTSNFVKKEDLKENGPLKGFIMSVTKKEFDSKERPGTKDIRFDVGMQNDEGTKTITANKTNSRILASYYGNDTDGWIGKPAIWYYDASVQFAGKLTGGIKVRVPSQKAKPATATQPAVDPIFGDDDDLL